MLYRDDLPGDRDGSINTQYDFLVFLHFKSFKFIEVQRSEI